MTIIRIEHSTQNFESWKQLFDSDPADRAGSGVRRYRVMRGVDDPNFVLIDLELDSREDAEDLLRKLRQLWGGPARALIRDLKARLVETVEERELRRPNVEAGAEPSH